MKLIIIAMALLAVSACSPKERSAYIPVSLSRVPVYLIQIEHSKEIQNAAIHFTFFRFINLDEVESEIY